MGDGGGRLERQAVHEHRGSGGHGVAATQKACAASLGSSLVPECCGLEGDKMRPISREVMFTEVKNYVALASALVCFGGIMTGVPNVATRSLTNLPII